MSEKDGTELRKPHFVGMPKASMWSLVYTLISDELYDKQIAKLNFMEGNFPRKIDFQDIPWEYREFEGKDILCAVIDGEFYVNVFQSLSVITWNDKETPTSEALRKSESTIKKNHIKKFCNEFAGDSEMVLTWRFTAGKVVYEFLCKLDKIWSAARVVVKAWMKENSKFEFELYDEPGRQPGLRRKPLPETESSVTRSGIDMTGWTRQEKDDYYDRFVQQEALKTTTVVEDVKRAQHERRRAHRRRWNIYKARDRSQLPHPEYFLEDFNENVECIRRGQPPKYPYVQALMEKAQVSKALHDRLPTELQFYIRGPRVRERTTLDDMATMNEEFDYFGLILKQGGSI